MSANVYESYWLSDQFVKLIKKNQLLSLYLSQICVKLSILRLGSLLWVTLVLICRRYQLHGCLLLLFSRFLSTANSDLKGNCLETATTTTTTKKKEARAVIYLLSSRTRTSGCFSMYWQLASGAAYHIPPD